MDKSLEKKGSKVRIMALEKKANFGNITSTFTIDVKLSGIKDIIFLTLNKFKSRGKYSPVWKTECLEPNNGVFGFNSIGLDTDTLFNGEENDDECLI